MRFILPMLALVPVALVLEYGHIGGATAVFLASALSLIPLAGLLGRATEEAAIYTGPRIGALLNATLGNAAELIITIIALREGLVDLVKASIAGSIIGNILVVLGLSLLLGGLKNGTQFFDAKTAGIESETTASPIIVALVPADFASKNWVPFFNPPSNRDKPNTTRIFPMIDPAIDAFTRSTRPSRRAMIVMISSAAFPNVALRSAPIRGPV